ALPEAKVAGLTSFDCFSPTMEESAAMTPRAPNTTPHRLAVLALPGLIAFDLASACEVFGHAELAPGQPCYRIAVCGERKSFDNGS
ncbi:hypothetical protein, partial [Enterococcus casseliflavus]|uniref:hypothetical protein n=1 Tax=Enterococcus casseliflavus TaxID=37734 RepID=UPI003D0D395B